MTTTEVNRSKWLQSRRVEDLNGILDSGLVAHVALVRDGDAVPVHGSTGAGLNQAARDGVNLSLTVTLIDGQSSRYSHQLCSATVGPMVCSSISKPISRWHRSG